MNHRYLVHLTATCGLMLALVALFNLIVDPNDFWRLVRHPGFNLPKARPAGQIAQRKLFSAVAFRPEAVILGNSRADIGFNPAHPDLQRRAGRTYNLAVPGAGIDASANLLAGLCSEVRPNLVLFGVDFIDFLSAPGDSKEDTAPSQLRTRPTFVDRLQWLLTADATMESARSLRAQLAAFPQVMLPDGFNPLHDYIPIARSAGYQALFEQRLQENISAYRGVRMTSGEPGATEAPEVRALRRMIRTAGKCGAELVLVTYPYHSQLLLLFDELGLWPQFEQWKRVIVRVVDEERARDESLKVRLFDYAYFSGPSQEAIPAAGDRSSEMRWYWEAGHFKKTLGDRVLATVLAGVDSPTAKATLNGLVISGANVESWLAEVRQQKREFVALRPPDLEVVRRAVARSKAPST